MEMIGQEIPKDTRRLFWKESKNSTINYLGRQNCFDVPSKNSMRQQRIKLLKLLARGGQIPMREEIRFYR